MVAVVRTGDEYQAEVPPLLPPEQQRQLLQAAAPRYVQRWGQPPASATDSDVEHFLAGLSHFSEVEQALQCLFASGFDVAAATDRLLAGRRERVRGQEGDAQRLSDEAFGDALASHGKKFHLVKQALPAVESTREVVRKFYLWKASAGYARWREADKARKRKESTRALRRRWGDDSDSDAPSDYHNEYCDLCFTGGQLLCCDGCCRAFHFSCVTPPIKEVPKDDWFCAQCRAVLQSDAPQLRPSDENAFCSVVLIDGRPLTSATSEPSASKLLRAVGSDSRAGSDRGDGDSDGADSVEKDSRAQQTSASLTDNDESDEDAASYAAKKLQREKATAAKRWASGASVDSSPSPSLASTSLLSASSSRKRQRKIDAPRRLLLSDQPPSAAGGQAPARVPARATPFPGLPPSVQ